MSGQLAYISIYDANQCIKAYDKLIKKRKKKEELCEEYI